MFQNGSWSLGIRSGGGTPDDEVVSVQVVVVEASVDVICCVAASVVEVIWTVDEVSVADVDIVVVLVFDEATSPFSSFLIRTARDDVELRRLNFAMLRVKNKGLRTADDCKESKKENC